ncbi:MAG: hypothetical protein JW876_12505, partial [Candidatus Krumholzibacteriota bacterium]|nr:hypothetical protein [Candidatus Krumholzibacteriota bacterium]
MRSRVLRSSVLAAAILAFVGAHAGADDRRASPFDGKSVLPDRAITLGGEFIHNIGELQMNVTNWGFFGSLPKSTY